MKEFIEKLKARLLERKSNYLVHYSMMGDTEGGFYEQDEFDMDKLLKEIDQFTAEFQSETPPASEQEPRKD